VNVKRDAVKQSVKASVYKSFEEVRDQ